MNCLCCGYPLAVGSLVSRKTLAGIYPITIERYKCRTCQAEMTVAMTLKKLSPLPFDELKRKLNRPGGHAR